MRTKTIEKNMPKGKKKAKVFSALAAYYEVVNNIGMKMTKRECRIGFALEMHSCHGKRIPDFSNEEIGSFDKSQFMPYVPCHRRKRAMFFALLAFVDEFGKHSINDYFKGDTKIEKMGLSYKVDDAYTKVMESVGYEDEYCDFKDGWEERYDKEVEEEKKEYLVTFDLNGHGEVFVSAKSQLDAEKQVIDKIGFLLDGKFTGYSFENMDAELL